MFASPSSSIAEGDLVILYYGKENINSIIVEAGKDINSRYGHFRHADMVGIPYGSKFPSSNGRGFVYLLRPTPELWTQALPHRTQILYMPDIAFICSFLGIGPGSKVIEAGTGSGSFSHSVARTIGDAGKLFSFEFHEERFQEAQLEFASHKLDQITLQHRNVCKDGFGEDLEQGTIDAVFLDLPAPWEAVEAAKATLRADRPARICCFSPCIEQVIRTVTALGANGFSEITMYETLTRHYEPFAQAEEGPSTVQDVINKLKSVVEKKDARRLVQISVAKEKKAKKEKALKETTQMEVDGTSTTEQLAAAPTEVLETATEAQEEEESRPAKKVKLTEQPVKPPVAQPTIPSTEAGPSNTKKRIKKSYISDNAVLKPLAQLRGHTSYLTFATLIPISNPASSPLAEPESTPTEAPASEQMKVPALKTNGLKKTESLVELKSEDVAMLAEGVSFDDSLDPSIVS